MKKTMSILVALLILPIMLKAGEIDNNIDRINNSIYADATKDDYKIVSGRKRVKTKFIEKYAEGKDPLIASGLSLLLPGAGEFYGESYIRSGIFLGIEATTLSLYFVYSGDGDDKTDEFHSFANKHFNESAYYKGIYMMLSDKSNHSITLPDSVDLDYIRNRNYWGVDKIQPGDETFYVSIALDSAFKYSGFTHNLPGKYRDGKWVAKKTQQYYEMIGKYHQFAMGWDDFNAWKHNDHGLIYRDENGNIVEPNEAGKYLLNGVEVDVNSDNWNPIPVNPDTDAEDKAFLTTYEARNSGSYRYDSKKRRNAYENLRDEANNAYETGQTFIMLTLLNHVVSSFDASFVIKSKYGLEKSLGSKIRIDRRDEAEKFSMDNFKLTYSLSW